MPQFAVHYVETHDKGVTLFRLSSFEAYGELNETLHDARLFARERGFDALRLWLRAEDYDRLLKRDKRHMETVGIELVIYQEDDSAPPGNAMMVIRDISALMAERKS